MNQDARRPWRLCSLSPGPHIGLIDNHDQGWIPGGLRSGRASDGGGAPLR
jgi:hypothetical protein